MLAGTPMTVCIVFMDQPETMLIKNNSDIQTVIGMIMLIRHNHHLRAM